MHFNIDPTYHELATSFKTELTIINLLQTYQLHPNVIRLCSHFIDVPPADYFDLFPNHIKERTYNLFGSPLRTSVIVYPHYPYTLREYLSANRGENNRSLSFNEKLVICRKVGNALLFLYENGIAHRDLKLEHVLIGNHGELVINGFGSAIVLDQQHGKLILHNQSLGGNKAHLAPEFLINYAQEVRKSEVYVDYTKQVCWEFGMISFEILFGEYPDQFLELLEQVDGELSSDNYSELRSYFNEDLVDRMCKKFNDYPRNDQNSQFHQFSNWILSMLIFNSEDRVDFPTAFDQLKSFLFDHIQNDLSKLS